MSRSPFSSVLRVAHGQIITRKVSRDFTHLRESDRCRLLTEALAAKVKAVLADETSLMRAEAAIYNEEWLNVDIDIESMQPSDIIICL